MKILIVNSFPDYMNVRDEDVKWIESDLAGDADVVNLGDITDEMAEKNYDTVVSFNCVNIFHPEISKVQVNAQKIAKILDKLYAPTYIYSTWHNEKHSDENYSVKVYFKQDSNAEAMDNEGFDYFNFAEGEVPSFVAEDTAY